MRAKFIRETARRIILQNSELSHMPSVSANRAVERATALADALGLKSDLAKKTFPSPLALILKPEAGETLEQVARRLVAEREAFARMLKDTAETASPDGPDQVAATTQACMNVRSVDMADCTLSKDHDGPCAYATKLPGYTRVKHLPSATQMLCEILGAREDESVVQAAERVVEERDRLEAKKRAKELDVEELLKKERHRCAHEIQKIAASESDERVATELRAAARHIRLNLSPVSHD